MYCHRKFEPPSKPRLCYTAEFKAEVVLEALSGESSQAEVCIGLNKRWHFNHTHIKRLIWHRCPPPHPFRQVLQYQLCCPVW